MSPRAVVVLVIVAASCGRIGYDQTAEVEAKGVPSSGGGVSMSDAASGATAGVDGASGFGGTTSNGGASGNGGHSGGGGAIGKGGASDGGVAGNGGTSGNGGSTDGAVGSGGTVGSDARAGSGGAVSRDGSAGSGGFVGGDAGIVGCADGQREGFLDLATYPSIAACDGGFQVPGIVGLTGPACARAAGDDGARPDGAGCNVEDLCAVGFHVCTSATEVGAKSGNGGCTDAVVGAVQVFYLTLQSGGGQQKCGAGTDDVFGCGGIGFRAGTGCTPLDRASGNLCGALIAPWSCGTDQVAEALYIAKAGSAAGGVLCCAD